VAESKLPRHSKPLRFYLWLMHLATQAGQLFRQEKLRAMDLWPLSSVWPQLLVVLVEGEMVEARQEQEVQLEEQQMPSAKAWGILKERVEKDEPTRKVVQVRGAHMHYHMIWMVQAVGGPCKWEQQGSLEIHHGTLSAKTLTCNCDVERYLFCFLQFLRASAAKIVK
jgi:hypothetical protein